MNINQKKSRHLVKGKYLRWYRRNFSFWNDELTIQLTFNQKKSIGSSLVYLFFNVNLDVLFVNLYPKDEWNFYSVSSPKDFFSLALWLKYIRNGLNYNLYLCRLLDYIDIVNWSIN